MGLQTHCLKAWLGGKEEENAIHALCDKYMPNILGLILVHSFLIYFSVTCHLLFDIIIIHS